MSFVCDQWFIDQLVNGSILGCWLQVAGDLDTFWLPGYLLPGYWISFDSLTNFSEFDEVSRFVVSNFKQQRMHHALCTTR